MSYIVGVSSGIFGAAPQEEKSQYAGVYRKAQYCITKGVEFVQIDLESISEFQEADLQENMKRIKDMGITFGFHSETPAFGGREFPHLDSAIDTDYERGHRRLLIVLENAGKIEAKYVLMHSSESTPFILLGRELQPTELVDCWGRPLGDFIEEQGKLPDGTNWIKEWIWAQEYIWLDILHDTPDAYIRRLEESRRFEMRQHTRRDVTREKAAILRISEEKVELTAEDEKVIKEREEHWWEVESKEFHKREKEELLKYFLRLIKSKTLSYGPERTAYYIIAKWMEKNNDPLWKNIVNASIEYYAKVDGKTKEQWLKDKEITKLSIDDEKFRLTYQIWVAAVSAKYVWGHFNQDKCPDKKWKKYPDSKEFLKKYKMPFLLETPMAAIGLEEWLRFSLPSQIHYLCKELGFEYFGFALDIEHLLMCNINPDTAIEVLPEDAGKYITVVHAGWPSPLGPAHIPIALGSDQQFYLYKIYYKMKQKGFGKDPKKEYVLIFERGGGADPIQQSVMTLKKIVEFLEKDIAPEELMLRPEFFGLKTGELASPERQRVVIFEHARDPLRGLITTPEEEFTFLGKAATEKPGVTPEKWKKEELR